MVRLVPTHRTTAEVYCSAWARMNEGVSFAIRANEVHYLKTLALGMDDDLASLLLLKKLNLAASLDQAAGIVGMNSCVEFRFGSGRRQIRQLVHPTACQSRWALSIGTRLGTGLIGLRAEDVLLWPDDDGSLRELQIIAVQSHGQANDGDGPPPLAG